MKSNAFPDILQLRVTAYFALAKWKYHRRHEFTQLGVFHLHQTQIFFYYRQ